jgi:DNA-binding NarL/FixJ family response regulator
VTRVAVVAATASDRARLESVIARTASLTVTVAASSVEAVTGDARLASSDVVVMHAAMHELTPRELLALPPIPIVVLLRGPPTDDSTSRLLAVGARGVVPDDSTAEEIEAAIEAAAAGLVVLAPEQIGALVRVRAASADRELVPRRNPGRRGVLTPREQEILGMLAEGLPNKSIAARLGISDHTVKTHLEAIFDKLGASTRAEAVAQGVRSGLLLL